MKKPLKIVICVLVAVVLLLLLAVAGFALCNRIMFADFYSNSEKYEKIPALWNNYVPQGYNNVVGTDMRLACGYMSDGTASQIYILRDNQEPVCVEMKNADGSDYTGHTGGIDVIGDYVYVTGKTGCDILSLEDILDGDGVATLRGEVKTINDPAYCVVKDNVLFCGSFYHAGDYETPKSHRLTTPAGDENLALISAYSIDASTGLPYNDYPDFVISTPALVQAMEFIDDTTVALATSYGLAKSHIYIYDIQNLAADPNGFEADGRTVPLYHLDSSVLKQDIVAPPMAEQIFYNDGKIYIMNESASMKYLFGKISFASHVYAYKYN